MIRLTYEEKQELRKLRHEIIDKIMEIKNTKALNVMLTLARETFAQECQQYAVPIDEAIEMTDINIIYRPYKMICKENEKDYVSDQIKECCEYKINRHIQYGGSISELESMQKE